MVHLKCLSGLWIRLWKLWFVIWETWGIKMSTNNKGGHSVITLAKFSKKLTFLIIISYQGVRNVSFSKKFFEGTKWMIPRVPFQNILPLTQAVISSLRSKTFWCWRVSTGSNPINANPTKWSNTLKQFGCCGRIVWMCLIIMWGWHLEC